jgi:hypothetical protein
VPNTLIWYARLVVFWSVYRGGSAWLSVESSIFGSSRRRVYLQMPLPDRPTCTYAWLMVDRQVAFVL